jgi:ryanodine receptor 2
LECFVDFCEDAIFEMQHAESLMKSSEGDDGGGGGGGKSGGGGGGHRKRKLMRPDDDEDEPKGIVEPLKKNVMKTREAALHYLSYLSPASISAAAARARTMSAVDLSVLVVSGLLWTFYGFGYAGFAFIRGFLRALLFLMRGEPLFAFSHKKEEGFARKMAIEALVPKVNEAELEALREAGERNSEAGRDGDVASR